MGSRKAILVVEDEPDLCEVLRHNLEREGYVCRCVTDGRAALDEVRQRMPDLIVLDRMLPGLSGDDVIGELKRRPRTSNIPTLMLTAKADETDALVGFALGADDYVTKPFSMKLLLARVSALLRRAGVTDVEPEVLSVGPVLVDVGRHKVVVDGLPVAVTATEFRLLRVLMAANGRVLSRGQLIDSVMGSGVAVTDRTIDVHVAALRKNLGPGAGCIRTIRGVGYTFREPE